MNHYGYRYGTDIRPLSISGRISGKSNPVSGWIPDIKRPISGAFLVNT
jgi:hypothetical protein